MNIITEKNSFSSNSFWEEVSDKKARKQLFILILEGELTANDEKYLPQWKSLLYALIELNAKEDLIDHVLMPFFAECFFDKILTKAVKDILACDKLLNKEFNQVLDAILTQTLLIWSKNLRNGPLALWNIVYDQILEVKNPYYKIKKSMLDLESPLETPTEHTAWLQTLKKGDTVDCVKTVEFPQKRFSLKVWSYAEVLSVNDKSIQMSFIKDSEKSQEMSKTASCHEIAPYKTKCDDFDWRMSLQPEDELDACDECKKWYNATVIETRENFQGEKEVLVGYRSYSEDGDKVDSKGRKCFGYIEKYDKWFNATSPFIAKKNLMTKSSDFDKDGDSLSDSLGMIFKPSSPEQTVYAVYQEGRCESIAFVNIINQFGQQGGFENMSQALLDKANQISNENGNKVCKSLSKLNEALHRPFVKEYAPKLQDYWGPLGIHLEQPISLLGNFLKRIYSDKTITDIVESYQPPKPPKGPELDKMNSTQLLEYLEQNGLPQEYLENHEKRNKLFYVSEYELRCRTVKLDTVARLWAAIKPNDKAKIDSVCKDILTLYYYYIHPERSFLTPLVDHLFEANPEDLAERSVELLMQIFEKAKTVPEGYHEKFYDFLQRSIYVHPERFSYSLLESLNERFARLSNDFLSADEILQILYKYTDNVAQHILILPSLNLIGRFFRYEPKADKKFSQETYMEHLCQEKNLIEHTLQAFRFSKQQLIEKIQGQTVTVQLLESLLPVKMNYISNYVAQMTGSVTFLHERCPGNKSKLEILKELWDITVNNSLIPEEKMPILREVREIIASQEGSHMKEDDLKFFINGLNCLQNPTDLCSDVYQCYIHFFVTLHEKLGNIYDVMLLGSTHNLNSSYGDHRYDKFVRGISTGEQSFEFKVRVPVEKLEGFDQIWKFMLFSENDQVSNYAIDFHAMVYSNLNNESRNKGESLWQGFFTTVKRYLNEILENKESVATELLNKRLSRCLKSVTRMLKRTERSVLKGFQPHWKLNHRGNIRIVFPDINKEDRIKLSYEQTIQDLIHEYEKKKGIRVGNQVQLRDNAFIYYENKPYLPLFEAVVEDGDQIFVEEDKPILGFLLANQGKDLDPRAKVIFKKWFEEFSANGKMNPEQFGMFLQSVNRDITVNSNLVKDTFKMYEKNGDGLLTLSSFLAYYQASCAESPLEVWNDIATRGEMYGSKLYKLDEFGKVQEAVEPNPEISPSLRSQMALDNELLELLHSILKQKEGNGIAYWLLKRLPTNPIVFSDIITLRGVRDVEEPSKRDWEQVLASSSPHAFLYALDIIDYLFISDMEDDNPDETRESISGGLDIWFQNPELLEHKKTWCQDFIKLGGSKHLSEAMEAVKKHPNFQKAYDVQAKMEKIAHRVFAFLCFDTEEPKAKKSTL